MANSLDTFGTRDTLNALGKNYRFYSLEKLAARFPNVAKLPVSMRILLENLLRHEDGGDVDSGDIEAIANWDPANHPEREIAFRVARVVLQDFTGVPAVVDLAAMRDAVVALGGDPQRVNPLEPADLVIDHSVQVDFFGDKDALRKNQALEFERNLERYQLLRWGQGAFHGFRVVPPAMGIVHQVNLEYLAPGVQARDEDGGVLYPDTLVGTDSHTTMINALGVVGWGVGGIEAEASLLGQPIAMLIPQVVGFRLVGKLPEGATATDLVLRVVQMLRKKGVVEKFVEFYGPGLAGLPLTDRATIANMAPEYGATMGFFPVDAETIEYLRFSGRSDENLALTEAYFKAQGLFQTESTPEPMFNDTLELDLSTVEPALAGPKRPQDRVALSAAKASFQNAAIDMIIQDGRGTRSVDGAPDARAREEFAKRTTVVDGDQTYELGHGSVVIAAITSCTNTSNPSVIMAAGLLAKKALQRGLTRKPWVKTSLAPGSRVVVSYLERAGLLGALEAAGFYLVGFGCTTCIGNSGPLPDAVLKGVTDGNLVATAVLSGNRNFEARISPNVRANYLASPPLVVAYALAGRMDLDLTREPLGEDQSGKPVFLKDIWPTNAEIAEAVRTGLAREMFTKEYATIFDGDAMWQGIVVPQGATFAWDPESTYVRRPPFFENLPRAARQAADITGTRVLAKLGDSVTTDHISPAGNIAKDSPAARYLVAHGVERKDWNSYGARRGNHEVMMRGTFANVQLRNQLAPGTQGGVTTFLPTGEVQSIYDAAMRYAEVGTSLVILAGKEYGTGSSRDWAAKGTVLLGVKAVLVESFERIHRSNLVGMGVLPLQYMPGESAATHSLDGTETFSFTGLEAGIAAGQTVTVTAQKGNETKTFTVRSRIDTPSEVQYYLHGGVLQYVLRRLGGLI